MIGGVSGDMLIGGLLDLGVEISELNEALLLLPIKGLKLRKQEVIRGPIKAILAEPIIDQKLADMHFSWSDFFDLINNFLGLILLQPKIRDHFHSQIQI